MARMEWSGSSATPAAYQTPQVRSWYLRRVYGRLVVGVVALVALLSWMFTTGLAYGLAAAILSVSWLLILGGFMVVSWLANRLTFAEGASPAAQWGGYALLVVANAVLFTPLIVIAEFSAPGVVATAGWYTLAGFAALSVVATRTQRSYSWLGQALTWAGMLALAAIVIAVIGGFELGVWFSLAMIGLAGAAVLYDTQDILEHGVPGREVVDAMRLFSSVALMFWYVLRLLAAVRR